MLFCVLRIRIESRDKENTVKFLQTLDSKQTETTSFPHALKFTKRNRTSIMSYYASSALHETRIIQTPIPFTWIYYTDYNIGNVRDAVKLYVCVYWT